MSRILIVEDDLTLNNQVAGLLREKGFAIEQSHDGQHGLLQALQKNFDLILLDVLLPNINGFSVLNLLRREKQTPVMMLTACGAEQERIEGYSKGADDYLPKPFNFTEMLLRIEALLRRAYGQKNHTKHINQLQLDKLLMTRANQQVCYADQDIPFTPTQFQLLWLLVENRGQVLSKAYLYHAVLERNFSRYDRSLDMHLSRLRKKLSQAGMTADRFTTVHGKGYRFL